MYFMTYFLACTLIFSGCTWGMYDPRLASFSVVTPNPKEWVKRVPNKTRVDTLELRIIALEKKIKEAGIK